MGPSRKQSSGSTLEATVAETRQVRTIQVVVDAELLNAVERAAKHAGCNRSALVRRALRAFLANQRATAREAADRAGYERIAADPDDSAWDKVVAWPHD
jgi:metal-responsive CopG/Arc/MetJ family transcriptional regulator